MSVYIQTKRKTCKTCGKEKDIDEFYGRTSGYYSSFCKKCTKERQKQTPRKVYPNEYHREKRLKNVYNLTKEQYSRLHSEQGGKCAICGIPETELKKNLCVDHDHKTGKIRGLLCTLCNQGLGSFKDNQSNVENALYYLILHK